MIHFAALQFRKVIFAAVWTADRRGRLEAKGPLWGRGRGLMEIPNPKSLEATSHLGKIKGNDECGSTLKLLPATSQGVEGLFVTLLLHDRPFGGAWGLQPCWLAPADKRQWE